MVKGFSLFLFPLFLWGIEVRFTNLTEEIIPSHLNKTRNYKIFAKYHKHKIIKEDLKELFFNYKKFMLKNNVYLDGFFNNA